MIKEKIYNLQKVFNSGVSYKDFFYKLLGPIDKSLMPENVVFKNLSEVVHYLKDNKEKTCIVGHNDPDGTTSTAILDKAFHRIGIPTEIIISERFDKECGLSIEIVKKAISNGFRRIITVDNGISSDEALKYAKINDVQVIITDHHLPTSSFWKNWELYLLHPRTM